MTEPHIDESELPVPKVVDISIGHSNLARGAKGVYQGRTLREWEFARKVRAALEEWQAGQHGPLPFSFRFWDHLDYPKWGIRKGKMEKSKILLDRLRAMYQNKKLTPQVQIALALHNNASKNTKYGGLMNIYRMEKDDPEYGTFEDEEGKILAGHLQKHLLSEFPGLKDRKVQADQGSWVSRNLGFTRWGYAYEAVPVIIEFGFITCPNDQQIIAAADTPHKYAAALVAAVKAYLKELEDVE